MCLCFFYFLWFSQSCSLALMIFSTINDKLMRSADNNMNSHKPMWVCQRPGPTEWWTLWVFGRYKIIQGSRAKFSVADYRKNLWKIDRSMGYMQVSSSTPFPATISTCWASEGRNTLISQQARPHPTWGWASFCMHLISNSHAPSPSPISVSVSNSVPDQESATSIHSSLPSIRSI